ncbi:MAG: type II toxin-antitoxin system RelE/ParE family toxin [Thaumarchaeota archaeon]|nr:type II toxin-antitoxin system RelE/ParE family toxin [Nitrososphaerota archaeon]
MKVEVRWTETAIKQLKKLDKATSKTIIDRVEEIKSDPFSFLKKLQSVPLYSLRVGNYRVILSIERNNLVILDVGHRNKIYLKY